MIENPPEHFIDETKAIDLRRNEKWREMAKIFYHSSNHFKLVSLLYWILCFYLITGFRCLYKTKQVVVVKPFHPKSYQESLEQKSSLAFYYDQFTEVSNEFRDAPAESLRGKLWAKLVASGRQREFDQVDSQLIWQLVFKMVTEMSVHKSICIGDSLTLPLIQGCGCALSPEGQLYFTEILSDPSGPKFIYGYALSKEYRYREFFSRKQRHIFESQFLAHHYRLCLDPTDLLSTLSGSSKEHKRRQRIACTEEDSFTPHVQVKAITLSYFKSFFAVCAIVWLLAFIIHFLQIHDNKRERILARF